MTKYFTTPIGRLRLYGFLEGTSLLLLVFVAVPIKYMLKDPSWVKAIGPVHGALFILFVISALWIAAKLKWKLSTTAWIILVSSFIPFGTFYIDHTILRNITVHSK